MSTPSPLEGHRLDRPTRELLQFGPGALTQALRGHQDYVLVTQPGPRAAIDREVVAGASAVIEVDSLERRDLEQLVAQATDVREVVGVGGGMVMDAAKWIAFRTSAPLILAPSSVSVDACVTNSVAVRNDGVVVYEGFVVAERVVVDVHLVRTAPAEVNRAGIGDLLSIHTALWDWEAGSTMGGIAFDRVVARRAAQILDGMEQISGEIARGEERAVQVVIEGYADINDMTVACGHAQMEEGSEHYFAYSVEQATGASFIHGQLVTLGVVVMSRLQGNDPDRAVRIAEQAGVAWRPADLGLDRAVVTEVIASLREFVSTAHLPPSVINRAPLTTPDIDRILEGLF